MCDHLRPPAVLSARDLLAVGNDLEGASCFLLLISTCNRSLGTGIYLHYALIHALDRREMRG